MAIKTHQELAQLLNNIYSGPVGFDYYEPGSITHGGICFGIVRTIDENVIVLRGSKSPLDWVRDLLAIPTIFSHKIYGPVHQGFSIGMDRAADDIWAQISRNGLPITITGHSLGAARSSILTAIAIEKNWSSSGRRDMRRVVFGEPLSGFAQMADYINPVPATSYQNTQDWHVDTVTTVPFRLPNFDWVRACPLTRISGPHVNIIEEQIDPFALHHIELYAAAQGVQR